MRNEESYKSSLVTEGRRRSARAGSGPPKALHSKRRTPLHFISLVSITHHASRIIVFSFDPGPGPQHRPLAIRRTPSTQKSEPQDNHRIFRYLNMYLSNKAQNERALSLPDLIASPRGMIACVTPWQRVAYLHCAHKDRRRTSARRSRATLVVFDWAAPYPTTRTE